MPDRRQQLLSQLSAYLDDELSPPERAQIEALLADDADARRLLSELRATAEALHALPRARAGDDLMDKLRARLEREALLGESTPAATAGTRGGVFRSGKLIAVAAVIALSFAAAYMMWPQGRQAALKQFALNTPERKARPEDQAIEKPAAPKAMYDEETRRFYAKELKTKETPTPSATPAAQPAAPAAPQELAAREPARKAVRSGPDAPPPSAPQQPAERYASRGLAKEKVTPKPESLREETDALDRTVERYDGVTPPAPTAAPAPPAVAAAPPPAQPPTEMESESPPLVADAMARDKAIIIEGPPAPSMQGGLAGIVPSDELKSAAATAPDSGHGQALAAATPIRELGYFAKSAPSQEPGTAQRGGSVAPQMAVSTVEDGAVTVVDLAYATPQDQQQALASIASQYPAQELADTALLSLWAVTTNAARQFEDVQTQPALALADKDAMSDDSSVQPAQPSGSSSDQLLATAYEVVVPDESARQQILDDLAKSAGSVMNEPAAGEPVVSAGAPFSRARGVTAERGDTSPSQVATAPPETFDRSGGLTESAQVSNADSARDSESFAMPAASQAAPARRQVDVRMGRAARPQSPHPRLGQQVMPASQPMGQAGASQSNTLRLYLRVQPGQAARIQQLPAHPTQSPPAGPNAPRP